MRSTLKSFASSTTGTARSKCPRRRRSCRPGETLCNTDLGLPVTYVARPADAGTMIVNNAVVTVRTVGAEPQAFQAADPAEVEILAVGTTAGSHDHRTAANAVGEHRREFRYR